MECSDRHYILLLLLLLLLVGGVGRWNRNLTALKFSRRKICDYFPSTTLQLPRNHCLYVRFPVFARWFVFLLTCSIWSIDGVISTRYNHSIRIKTCRSAHFSATNRTLSSSRRGRRLTPWAKEIYVENVALLLPTRT